MLDLTDEQKRLFYTGGNFKDYVFDFPEIGLKITNDIIHQEAVTIKQSICDEQEMKLGGCLASSIEFEVSEIMEHDLTGLEFSATLYVNLRDDGTYDLKIPMGAYRVDSCKLVDDKDYKKVVAYDSLYDASVDVSNWYRSILPSDNSAVKLKVFRESLLEHLGLSYVKQTLINDDIDIEKTIEPSDGSMTGTSVLKLICELNGGFGKINREGLFEVINVQGLGLFPEEDLYPEETLYPEDHFQYMGMSDDNSYPEYKTTKYEEYMCPAPTCVTVKSTNDDYGTTVGKDLRNPYLISGNYLLYGKTVKELQEIAGNILKKIEFITYRPNTTQLWGLPYMDAGDVFALEKRRDDIESYVFTRTLTGVQGLWDTYEAKGSEIRDNKVSANAEIIQLKGKSLILKKSIDGVSSELTDFENQTSSKFEQTDTAISSEVKRASDAEGELSGRIDVTAENISAEVKRASDAEGELSGKIEVVAGQVVLKADANGRIVAVELTADPKNGTEFKVEADNISLSTEEAINLLAGGTLNLTGKNIKIESDNFTVDENGNATVNSIDILGGSINIGDKFVVDENGICSELEGDFIIQAKNLNLTAEEAINLLSGGTLNLSAKDINIESNNFIISSFGEVIAKSISIEGGSINIETCLDGENVILLKNAIYENAYTGPIRFFMPTEPDFNAKTIGAKVGDYYYCIQNDRLYKCYGNAMNSNLFWIEYHGDDIEIPDYNYLIRFYGSGKPKEDPDNMDARYSENYLDLETGYVYYAAFIKGSGGPMIWRKTEKKLNKEDISWKELQIGTNNSIEITEYSWQYYEDMSGLGTGEYFKVSNGISIQANGIELKKEGYNVKTGIVQPYDISGNIKLEDGDPDEYGNVQPYIVVDVPIKAPNIN